MTSASPPLADFSLWTELRESNVDEWVDLFRRERALLEIKNAPPPDKARCSQLLAVLLGLFPLRPLVTQSATMASSTFCLVPVELRLAVGVARLQQLQLDALDLLQVVLKKLAKVDAFSLWGVFLPQANTSPYRLALADLLKRPDHADLHQKILALLAAFVDQVGSFFHYVPKPRPVSARGSSCTFVTPYQSLGPSLETTHQLLFSHVEAANPTTPACVKALSSLLRQCPYRRLHPDLLPRACQVARSLYEQRNPVRQIAGLNLLLALLAPEVEDALRPVTPVEVCRLYLHTAADQEVAGGHALVVDRNVRYVALQNLAQLASVHMEALLSILDELTQTMNITLQDQNPSIILHTLRLVRFLAKNDPSRSDLAKKEPARSGKSSSSFSSASSMSSTPLLLLWSVLIKPKYFQAVEEHTETTLQAELCNCLSELSDVVYAKLPAQQQLLCLTYLLTHTDAREINYTVRTAAFRGLGMFATFPVLQANMSFLGDCTERIIQALDGANLSVTVSATWALANLTETLVFLAQEDPGLYEEYPRHYVLRLVELTTSYCACDNTNLTYISLKVNSLRSLGCLLQLVDAAFLDVADAAIRNELLSICRRAVDAVDLNIRSSGVMKLRWNACYAASRIVQNDSIGALLGDDHGRIVETVMHGLETCKNYKVQINATSVLLKIGRRRVFGADCYGEAFAALVRRLEHMQHDLDEEGGGGPGEYSQTQHKMDLVDGLCQALGHLVSLSESRDDLLALETLLTPDRAEVVANVLSMVQRRLSPEKTSVFIRAAEQINDVCPSERDAEQLKLVFGTGGNC